MGCPKMFLDFNGKPLIRYSLEALGHVCSEIMIVTQTPDLFKGVNAKVVTDAVTQAGPMGGLFTGLECAQNHWSIAIACDMPYIRKELLNGLIAQLHSKIYKEAIVPLGPENVGREGGRQPLCALYSKNCLPVLHRLIMAGRVSLLQSLSELETQFLSWLDLDRDDREGISFLNLNTPPDLKLARENFGAPLST